MHMEDTGGFPAFAAGALAPTPIRRTDPMARILAAINRALGSEYREPAVHFHAAHDARPEVCYEQACSRPRLHVG